MMDTETFLRMLPGPIAVVGNGPQKDNSAEIDSHTSVIRMNNFQWSPEVGLKISAWFTNCWQDVPARDFGVPVFTVFHCMDDNGRPLKWRSQTGIMDLIMPSRQWSEEVRQCKRRKPSSGLTLLWAFETLQIPCSAYGFAGLKDGHYWDADHKHDHPSEVEALKSLRVVRVVP